MDGKSYDIRQTVTLYPLSGTAGEQERGFFQQVTKDIAETVFRLKSIVCAAGSAF